MDVSSVHGRIVVGVDGSEEALHALEWSRHEAELRGAVLRVVHAWAPPAPVSEIAAMASPLPVNDVAFEDLARDVVSYACSTITPSTSTSLSIEPMAVRGYPSSVLLQQATEADLLVVGSRGRGGFASLLLGSVSHQCVHHAVGPVAVIPSSASLPGADEVVVGVDGSVGSGNALRWAIDEAATRGARLCVLHAWSTPYPVSLGDIGVTPFDRHEFADQSEVLLHEVVDSALAHRDRPKPEIEFVSVEEPAAPALLERAKDAGLLVVGGRGRGGFAAMLLGSVSQQCLHHATCAVVVVPHLE